MSRASRAEVPNAVGHLPDDPLRNQELGNGLPELLPVQLDCSRAKHHASTTAGAGRSVLLSPGVVADVRTDEVLGAENDKEVKNRNDEQRR